MQSPAGNPISPENHGHGSRVGGNSRNEISRIESGDLIGGSDSPEYADLSLLLGSLGPDADVNSRLYARPPPRAHDNSALHIQVPTELKVSVGACEAKNRLEFEERRKQVAASIASRKLHLATLLEAGDTPIGAAGAPADDTAEERRWQPRGVANVEAKELKLPLHERSLYREAFAVAFHALTFPLTLVRWTLEPTAAATEQKGRAASEDEGRSEQVALVVDGESESDTRDALRHRLYDAFRLLHDEAERRRLALAHLTAVARVRLWKGELLRQLFTADRSDYFADNRFVSAADFNDWLKHHTHELERRLLDVTDQLHALLEDGGDENLISQLGLDLAKPASVKPWEWVLPCFAAPDYSDDGHSHGHGGLPGSDGVRSRASTSHSAAGRDLMSPLVLAAVPPSAGARGSQAVGSSAVSAEDEALRSLMPQTLRLRADGALEPSDTSTDPFVTYRCTQHLLYLHARGKAKGLAPLRTERWVAMFRRSGLAY